MDKMQGRRRTPVRDAIDKAVRAFDGELGTFAMLGLASLLLYLRTLAPDVFVSDFAEFQYLPAKLGLAHPNGFPFYMLLGWAWSHIPFGNVAWRMNLLSAIGGALAVGVTAGFAHGISRNRWVGVLSGGLVALTPTFWGYSLVAERYTLNLFFLVGSLWLIWMAGRESCKHPFSHLLLSSFLLGLGFSTHPSDTLFIPFWIVYALARVRMLRRRPQVWLAMIAAWVVPLFSFLYVPWRWSYFSGYPMVPGVGRSEAVYRGLVHVWYTPPATWGKEKAYILGLRGAAYGFARGGWRYAIENLGWLAPTWRQEISVGIALAALVGFVRLLFYDAPLAMLLAGFSVFLTLMVAYIKQGKNDAYLLPAFWTLLFFAGFSMDWIFAPLKNVRVRRAVMSISALGVVLLLICTAASRYPDRDMSRRSDIRRWWLESLNVPLEDNAALLGHWSDFTPFWYLQEMDGVRPGLLALFPPDKKDVIEPWLGTGRPLYLAAPTHGWAAGLRHDYELIPWGRFVRILPKGTRVSIPFARGVVHRMDGLALSVAEFPKQILPESIDSVAVRWKAERELPKDLFLELRLEYPGGGYVGVSAPLVIAWMPGRSIDAGTEGFSIVPVRLPLGSPPGVYRADLRVFHLHGNYMKPFSPEVIPVGKIAVLPTKRFDRSLLSRGEVAPVVKPRVGPLTMLAYSLSHQPVRPGDPIRLEFVWRVNRKISKRMDVRLRFWDLGHGRLSSADPLFQGSNPENLSPGTIIRTIHTFRAPKGLGSHTYLAEVRVFGDGKRLHWIPTDRLPIGFVHVEDRSHLWKPCSGCKPVQATFDGLAALEGFAVPASVRGGEKLSLRLCWHAIGETEKSYKVFVHLLDERGKIVAQHDSPPANGKLPTDLWIEGEYVEDLHELVVPESLPEGEYSLEVGLYDPATGARLPVNSNLPSMGNALEVTHVRVIRP